MRERHIPSCLTRVPVFSQLSRDEQHHVHTYLTPRYFQKGQYVLRAGHNQSKLMVLSRGSAKMLRTSKDGEEQIVRLLKPGDYVGELEVFANRPSAGDVRTIEDSSFCVLDRQHLHALLIDKPELSIRLLSDLSQRLEAAETLTESLGIQPTKQRILSLLSEIAEGRQEFELKIPKKDLAASIGITPETFSRTLKTLESRKLITVKGKQITLVR